MPTPVNTARQCLTDDAARSLDDAVAVARRRSHSQTTSLHAVSALLAPPSSMLREACARARSSAYSPRLQFRALELSVGVSLDRLPSSKTVDDPPVSNSLMAAIKRSQANQRRQPETFHLYHQMQQQNQSSIPNVKVELKHFIISILDDPIVSRVFGEAGFRSYDIKLAIVHPPPVSRFPRSRGPPMFLCNSTDSDSIRRSFNFPFAGGFSNMETGDENCRRIGEILIKKKGKNPLLIGVCANDALHSFTESVQRNKNGVLPAEIDGLSLICIQKEVCEFVTKGGNKELMGSKFKELGDMVESCSGSGIVVNYGGLEAFVDDGAVDSVSYVVSQLTGLLEAHGGKLWLIGAAGCHETYKKFLAKFRSIEKDWDLNLLPITSLKASIGGFYSKPSLIGSFVPFGGFFSSPSEIQCQLGFSNQSTTLCNLCNGKYEHELSVILKGGSTISVADKYSANLSSWLQKPDCDTSKGLDEANDDRTVLSAKLVGLQRKWNDICQRLHHPNWKESGKESCTNGSGSKIETVSSFLPMDLQKISRPEQNIDSKAENLNFQTNARVEVSKSQQFERGIPRSPSYPVGGLSLSHNCTSSSCATSVTTELGLGTLYESAGDEPRKPKLQGQKDRIQYFSGSVLAELDGFSEHTSNRIAQSSSSHTELGGKLDTNDFKSLWRVLSDKVSWQEEAVSTVCQTISHCRSGNGRRRGSNQRGDIWLSILGPDKVGKRKIATALAEIIFGSEECLISVDLCSENGISRSNSIFDCQNLNGHDVKCRGKTVVDYISEEFNKKPHSVVLLENIDKSDFLAQNSLSQAIRTGKFPDSHGREIPINNMVFIATSPIIKGDKNVFSTRENVKFSEERILEAKGWKMKIVIECIFGDATRNTNLLSMPKRGTSNPFPVNKRKLTDPANSTEQGTIFKIPKQANKGLKSCLDLNIPVEEMEEEETDYGNCDSDSASENSKLWLEDFFDQLDEQVSLKPFDFDAVAEEYWRKISLSFQKIVGSEPLLEIDPEAMVQILAASWLSDKKRAVEDWVEHVLCKSFAEAKKTYCLTGHHIVKLVACEGHPVEDQAPGLCLPARITLN